MQNSVLQMSATHMFPPDNWELRDLLGCLWLSGQGKSGLQNDRPWMWYGSLNKIKHSTNSLHTWGCSENSLFTRIYQEPLLTKKSLFRERFLGRIRMFCAQFCPVWISGWASSQPIIYHVRREQEYKNPGEQNWGVQMLTVLDTSIQTTFNSGISCYQFLGLKIAPQI